jgi:predicted RNase H-like HicB family nuclease
MKLTAIIEKSDDGWYVGQIEEVPAALSQGKTIEELMTNLLDALKLLMETKKMYPDFFEPNRYIDT